MILCVNDLPAHAGRAVPHEDAVNPAEDLLGRSRSVHSVMKSLHGVVVYQGSGLRVVRLESLLQGFCIVIGALDQGLAGDVVRHGLDGGGELLVVAPAAGRVDEAAGDASDQQSVVDAKLYDGIQVCLALF